MPSSRDDAVGRGSGTMRRLQALLQRETSGGALIPQVDGLRCIAIMAVLLYHVEVWFLAAPQAPLAADVFSDALRRLLVCGFFGVQLFFAISGFVLGLPFARAQLAGGAPVHVGRYFRRRLTRLEPPYILNLLLLATPLILTRGMDARVLESVGASVVYSHYFILGQPSWINHIAWSLEVEVQFYVLAPLLATVFRLRSNRWRRAVLLAAIVASGAAQSHSAADLGQGYTLANQLQYFLAGFLLADLYACRWSRTVADSWRWDMAGIVAWLGMIAVLVLHVGLKPQPYDGVDGVVMPLLILVAFAAAMRGRLWSRLLGTPAVYLVGGMCYTIYLWHYPLIVTFGPLIVPLLRFQHHWANDAVAVPLMVPLLLAMCSVLFVAFEKPFMRRDWPQRAWAAVRARLRPVVVSDVAPSEDAA